MSTPECTAPHCDRPAVAVVHVLHSQSVLIRVEHLDRPDLAIEKFRCLDCMHDEIDTALGLVT